MTSFSVFADNNLNGFSILAVKAEPADVATVLEALSDTREYKRQCAIGEVVRDPKRGMLVHPDGRFLQIAAYPDKRTAFLVRAVDSDWCVLFRTLDWARSEDCEWVQDTAQALSKELNTTALSVAGADVCDCRIYTDGKVAKKLNGVDSDKVAKLFDEHQIDVPDCTIAEDPACLLATSQEAERIDAAHELLLMVRES